MNIQPNSNVNFQANRILVAQKNNGKCVLDVFKLRISEDKPFAFKCYNALCSKQTKDLTAKQKDLKDFFVAFLLDKSSKLRNYYLGIKNGETLELGLINWQYYNMVQTVSQRKLLCIKDFIKDTVNYAFLADIKKTYPVKSLNFLESSGKYKRIAGTELELELSNIQNRLKDTKLTSSNERINLNKFLGIDDFETNAQI